jgi:hypothetical protein
MSTVAVCAAVTAVVATGARGQRLIGVVAGGTVHVFELGHGTAVEIHAGLAAARQHAGDLALDVADRRVVDQAQRRLEDAGRSLPRRARDRLSQIEINGVVDDAAAWDGEPGNQLESRLGAAGYPQAELRAVGHIHVGVVGAAIRHHHQPTADPVSVLVGTWCPPQLQHGQYPPDRDHEGIALTIDGILAQRGAQKFDQHIRRLLRGFFL